MSEEDFQTHKAISDQALEIEQRIKNGDSTLRQELLSDPINPYDINHYPDLIARNPDYDKSIPLKDFYGGWVPRDYQLPVLEHLENIGPYDGAVAASVWHRRAGKSLSTTKLAASMMWKRPGGLVLHVFPKLVQARRAIWRGRTEIPVWDEKKQQMVRTPMRFLDAFPERYRKSTNGHDMAIELNNGSIYQLVGTDGANIDSLVGSNPVGIIMDEYSIQDPKAWEFLAPIIAENGGWVWFVYTPRGENHGYDLYNRMMKEMMGGNKKVHCELLTIEDTKAISMKRAREIQAMTGMSEERFQQEFMCSWRAPLEGSYYAEEMSLAERDKRIGDFPWQSHLPVYTAWDIGRDTTSVWFYHLIVENGLTKIVCIDYMEGKSKAFQHWINECNKKPYTYADKHAGPHDLEVTEFTTGIHRKTFAKKNGFDFLIANKKISVEEGINAVRMVLSRCYFDRKKCKDGINALKAYSAISNDLKNTLQGPDHNWASHAADSFRYLAVLLNKMVKKTIVKRVEEVMQAIGQGDILS